MRNQIVKALSLVLLVTVGFATAMAALAVLSALLSPAHALVVSHAIAVMTSPFVLPIAMLAYIFSSKRFGVRWHWLLATIVSALAAEIARPLVVQALGLRSLAAHLRAMCDMTRIDSIAELQRLSIGCGLVSWTLQICLVLSITASTGVLLLLILWIERRFHSLIAAKRSKSDA